MSEEGVFSLGSFSQVQVVYFDWAGRGISIGPNPNQTSAEIHGKAAWTPCTAVHSDEILSSRAMSSARLLPPAAPAMPRETGRNREAWWVTIGKPGGLARFLTCRLDPLQLFEPQKKTVTMCLVISKNATRMFGYVWSCLATHSQCLECRFHA